jgi:hypothetical protein
MAFGGPTLHPNSNDLLNFPKRPPSRDDVTFVLGFSMCKMVLNYCKGERQGLLSPCLVFYPNIMDNCGQIMFRRMI